MKERLILSLFLIILAGTATAQKSSFKQPMFRDLKLTSSITKSYKDSSCVFHVAVIDEDFKTDISKRYFWYHQGELRTTQGNFTGKLLHGTYEKFDRDGKLLEKGNFDNGLKTGQWLTWYPTGNMLSHFNWGHGERAGKFGLYDAAGNKSVSGQFKRGMLNGTIYYFSNGAEIRKEKYRNGKLLKAKEKKKDKEKGSEKKKKFRLWGRKNSRSDSTTVEPVKEKRTRKAKKTESAPEMNAPTQNNLNKPIEPQPAPPANETKKERRKKKQRDEKSTVN